MSTKTEGPPSRLTTAIIQFASSESWEEDKDAIEKMIVSAKNTGAQLIALPDHLDGVSGDMASLARKATREEQNAVLRDLTEWAHKHKAWILCGCVFVKDNSTADSPVNNTGNPDAPNTPGVEKAFLRSFLLTPDGTIKARYNRTHLFHVKDSPSPLQREGDYVQPAEIEEMADEQNQQRENSNTQVIEIKPGLKLGLSSNFDVRFPGHYQKLAQKGANIFSVPALFSVPHGEAHWDTLLRARAIETCSYIIAPAQSGPHACGRYSWGQSMIVDPWGRIVANAGGVQSGIAVATIDLDKIRNSRKAMPCIQL